MRTRPKHLGIALLAVSACVSAAGQTAPFPSAGLDGQNQRSSPAFSAFELPSAPLAARSAPTIQLLLDFKDSDVKFDLASLRDILRDRKHEGWVLAAYPDPKTSRPLIGAGFSLDLPAREHQQRDPLNPHPFLEPSSAGLWQAAGLDPQRLQSILDQYDERLAAWSKRKFRNRIKVLSPQITDEEATRLLRISAIQAIDNAKAYCRNFDRLTPSQQMAFSQLVYQMGVNLEEFSQFLTLVNSDSAAGEATAELQMRNAPASDREYWNAVQQSLIQSQWARLYRVRAITVIAMLDPEYSDNPVAAQRRIGAVLAPAVLHRRRGRSAPQQQLASASRNRGKATQKKGSRARSKRRA